MAKEVALTVKCPHCSADFMDEHHMINNHPGIKLNIETTDGKKGTIWLSSIYGDYNYTCNFQIPPNEVVEFLCPSCNKNLRRRNITCESCGAPIVSLLVDVGGRVNICSRNGCKNHYIIFEDLDTIIRKFYSEYGYH